MSSADTAFKLFDKDRDGFITRAEFAKVIFSMVMVLMVEDMAGMLSMTVEVVWGAGGGRGC